MIEMIKRTTACVGLATAVAVGGSFASAETVACPTADPTQIYFLMPALSGACGTGSTPPEESFTFLGVDWDFSHKWDVNDTGGVTSTPPDGGDPVSITTFLDDGTWSLSGFGALPSGSQALMTLKQGQTWAGFILDLAGVNMGTGVLTGTWSVNGSTDYDDISNVSVYVNVIPTPLALPLIASAFGIAFAVRRFGKAKTA